MRSSRMKINEEHTDTEGGGSDITLSPTSVDTQIDSLLIAYERDAAVVDDDAVAFEGISIRKALSRLVEAEADGGDVTSDDAEQTDEPADGLTPKMNIDEFAQRVAALVETYTRRLDVETVIFNRAKNYIEREHGAGVAQQFEDILIQEHDIDLRADADRDPPPRDDFAVGGAGPSL